MRSVLTTQEMTVKGDYAMSLGTITVELTVEEFIAQK